MAVRERYRVPRSGGGTHPAGHAPPTAADCRLRTAARPIGDSPPASNR
ncbi:hypothetical protein [Streptomyces purpurascens]|uniref:Uncharacterized protein n=1 Tax=Streptomyces purpurascens TaxID=1924 RepID=A0ABZ1MUD8_STREF